MMKKLFIGSMALAAVIAGPAMAADMPVKVKAPPPPAYYDWSGAYVGFNVGGTWYDVERTYPNILGGVSFKSSDSDGIYGFHAGAQGQWGNWVLGIEAAYSACFRECQSTVTLIPLAAPAVGAGLEAFNKITNLFTVGPRLGYAWDRWMIYGTGGYATATVKGQYLLGGVQLAAANAFSGQSWNDGWFAGGGFEYMVHKGALVDVVLGVEYQHYDLRSKSAFTSAVVPLLNFDQDAVGDLVRARLTIKTQGFGWAY
jgi:outer membrane immunogenic protein